MTSLLRKTSIQWHAPARDTLLDQFQQISGRLAQKGWGELFRSYGFDLDAFNIRAELLKPLSSVTRDSMGCRNVPSRITRAIEPGDPSRSLLYYVWVYPGVKRSVGIPLEDCPTPDEMSTIENLVYGLSTPSLAEIREQYRGHTLALLVFSSRQPEFYLRGLPKWLSSDSSEKVRSLDNNVFATYVPSSFRSGTCEPFRVLPERLSAYIAVLERGGNRDHKLMGGSDPGRETSSSWTPVHKIFNGEECIRGMNLQVDVKCQHATHPSVIARLSSQEASRYGQESVQGRRMIQRDSVRQDSTERERNILAKAFQFAAFRTSSPSYDERFISEPISRDMFRANLIIRNTRNSNSDREWQPFSIDCQGIRNKQMSRIKIAPVINGALVYYDCNYVSGLTKPVCSELTQWMPYAVSEYTTDGAVDYLPDDTITSLRSKCVCMCNK